MPIVRSHNKSSDWQPKQEWPDDVVVQWGGRGVVISEKGSYGTAFFEAFPSDGSGGFLRGEGEDLDAAEASAFKQYSRQKNCFDTGGHTWSRAMRRKDKETRLRKEKEVPKVNTYTNGGCFCLKCGAFQTVMKPIKSLDEWKRPLSYSELSSITDGFLRPDPSMDARLDRTPEETRRTRQYRRKIELRAILAGIKLPDWRQQEYALDPDKGPFEEDDYMIACQDAVVAYYKKQKDSMERLNVHSMGGLFDTLTKNMLDRLVQESEEREQSKGFTP